MSKLQKLSGATYHKLKATREREERKSAASLQVFHPKKYVAKTKCKHEDVECTLELGIEERGDNAN